MARALRTVAAAAGVMIVLLGAFNRGFAADQGITGKKLLLKAKKVVLLSKDPGISITGSDPVGGADSSVTFDDGGGPVTFALPASLWSTKGPGKPFKYKNTAAPSGPSPVKVAILGAGLLKVVAKAGPFAVPSGAATIDVVFKLDGTTNTYSMTFSGTGDGNKFLVKDAGGASPTATPPAVGSPTPIATMSAGPGCGNGVREGNEECDGSDAASCPGECLANCTCCTNGSFVGGGCWLLDVSSTSESCDAVCAGQGLVCDAVALGSAGSAGTNATCEAVSEAVEGAAPGSISGAAQSCAAGSGCYLTAIGFPGGTVFGYTRCTSPATTCDAPGPTGCNVSGQENCGRVCACAPPLCGNNAKEGPEQCDGTDDAACPGQCLGDCTCAPPPCGDNVREGTEVCDGTDDAACPGHCLANCTCCTGGSFVGGGCWYLDTSTHSQSCDGVCADHGLSCDAAALGLAGSAGTNATCEAVSEGVEGAAPGSIGGTAQSCDAGSGCYLTAFGSPAVFGYTRCTSPATTCDAPGPTGCNSGVENCGRVCACY